MELIGRPFDIDTDLSAMLTLADRSPLITPHAADWPYRFSSWAADKTANGQVWTDPDGRIAGWVVLQTPFWSIDCVMMPDAPPEFYRHMLAWAQHQAAHLRATPLGRPIWFVSIDAACDREHRVLEAERFQDVSDVGENSWSKVLFEHRDVAKLEPISLPAGLTLRSLNPATEIERYVQLHREVFESENMTAGWRSASTRMADYQNDLDLVIASDEGELQGFGVGWLRHSDTGDVVGQIEPLGVRQAYRGMRLSRQMMTAAIERMKAKGATRVFVETDKERTAAMAAYHAQGFEVAKTVLVYRYDVPEA
jgi:ribosomal protein S18 acetylase RimI-like enzyme